MNTKNILKTLALAMLLVSACNKSEIANEENTEKKGFALPVTVNVTREGDDATKAIFNDGTKKLSFSEGDKLLVRGNDNSDGGAGMFAGMLDYDASEGKFSGTIYTQNEYLGTADALFIAANSNWVGAALFPNGYETYAFLSISGSGYGTSYSMSYNKAIAATKAAAVEQFSLESAKTYSSGFALSPENAIFNFSITGLTDGAKDVTLKDGTRTMFTGSVTPSSGTAAFALGARIIDNNDFPVNLKNVTLTIGGTDIDITDANNNLAAGKIYNITRNAIPGALIGQFSVSDTKKVYFSKGNLRYASGTWSFFGNQYDYYTSYSADARDKFGWSTSATTYGMNTSTSSGTYSGDFVDWGSNSDLQTALGTGWFTLSSDEWTYLFNDRSASTVGGTDNGRYAKAKVNNVQGMILFPDTYTHPAGVTAPTGVNATDATGWNGNNYSSADWTKMESAGCVFLPAAGYRFGSTVSYAGTLSYYWSATPYSSNDAYIVDFNSNNLYPASTSSRQIGYSVRLVRQVTE